MNLLITFWDWFTATDPSVTLAIGPLALAGIGAGLGLLKHVAIDNPRYNRQKQLAAETARYSPWTGMMPQMPEEPDALGGAMGFGLTGAALGQGLQTQAANARMQSIYERLLNKQLGDPVSAATGGAGVGSVGGYAPGRMS